MIALRDVRKTYHTRHGHREVLGGVDCEFRPGEQVGILGRNGAGTSTLLRLISGVERPSSGRVARSSK